MLKKSYFRRTDSSLWKLNFSPKKKAIESIENLPPAERVRSFIRMMQQMKSFKIKEEDTLKQRKKNNFIIIIKDGTELG